jgi:hypothetical protein
LCIVVLVSAGGKEQKGNVRKIERENFKNATRAPEKKDNYLTQASNINLP